MNLHRIAGDCRDEDCPAVYLSDRGTVVFQGDVVSLANGLRLGQGEQAVELPLTVVREAIRALGT
ncbi:hypothetical protein [Actinokineospora sp. HUAS TT18]|uniref:hypothetical protein n=1 Tax=Actinokineospora sp. HUAS TT18 TaxID=3447451 RepID=UPI003F51F40A